jgi:dihydroxy-acid dehydratase
VILSGKEILKRHEEEEAKGEMAYRPKNRRREIPSSLKAYAATVSSADMGAVRII